MQIATCFGFHRTTVARHLKQAGETLKWLDQYLIEDMQRN